MTTTTSTTPYRRLTQKAGTLLSACSVAVLTACSSTPPQQDLINTATPPASVSSKEVVFIHGMFVGPASWDQWRPMFEQAGYSVSVPAWPLHDVPMDRINAPDHLSAVGQLGLEQVLDHYRSILKKKSVKPILVGHSMGGLIVQKLLQEGLAQAAVVVDSVPPKGLLVISWPFLKSQWPILSPFVDGATPLVLSQEQFAYSFANQQDETVMKAAYANQVLPESRKVARDTLSSSGVIDFSVPRGPLLLIAGEKDQTMPAALIYKNFEAYRDTPARTDFQMFSGRDHWLIAGEGWQEVAKYALRWIQTRQGSREVN